MTVVQDLVAYGKDFLYRSLDWFHDASLSKKVAVSGAGCMLSAYGVYYVWFFGGTRRVRSSVNLKGKTVLITGANAGIGRETAVDLASRGARVIMGCRNPVRAQAALTQVRKRSRNDNVNYKQLDLSDLKSVRRFAEEILREEERLDILINNAGMVVFSECSQTPGEFDITMVTNHVGHFMLTLTLIDLIKKSAPSRIINVSSVGHRHIKQIDYTNVTNTSGKEISGFESYCRSKLANIHFTKELARRLEGTGVTAYSLHPGTVYTSIWESGIVTSGRVSRYLWNIGLQLLRFFMLSEKDGAQTTIYCAIDESTTHFSGRYFTNCSLGNESKLAEDGRLAKQLWDVSCEATGINPNVLPA